MNPFIVVTGGTKGIGKAIIYAFAAKGFDVFANSRNEHELLALKEEVDNAYASTTLHYCAADVSKLAEVKRLISEIKKLGRPVDVLVNNAGLFVPGAVSTEPEGNLEMMIETNVYSAYHLTRGLLPDMTAKKSGHIFNICSTASIIPYINGGSYCISKFALLGMSKVLREEMKTLGIRVTAVLPGATLTASWAGVDLPEERFIRAEDVAAAVLNAWEMSDRTVIEELLIRPQLGDI
ncbi:MAG: SDR family oxidoreductase [Cyclobacteriaceae bacterium]